MIHNAKTVVVKAAEKLLVELGDNSGIIITIIIEDMTNPDMDKGLFICTNVSTDPIEQKLYLAAVAKVIKST